MGSVGTPYEKGRFRLDIYIPDKYPFIPPVVRFVTPIYHPNIDDEGRICLDILKMPPKGAWSPCLNLSSVLASVQQLMVEPNPDDPLVAEISHEYKYDKSEFLKRARKRTMEHAYTPMTMSEGLQNDSNDSSSLLNFNSTTKRCSKEPESLPKRCKF